jgi:hypothetical protein
MLVVTVVVVKYTDGSKSNNTVYNSPVSGTITEILKLEGKGGYTISITK